MKVLIFIAHADDETIGAGGLIARLLQQKHDLQLIIASKGIFPRGGNTSIPLDDNFSDFKKACAFYGIENITSLDLEDQFFDRYPIAEIINKTMSVTDDPDLIISHSQNDLNKDHRIIGEVSKVIGRPKHKPVSILGMEIGGTGPWNGSHFCPQLYVNITETIQTKLKAFSFYKNEVKDFPYPYSMKGLEVIAQNRGIESGCEYAEAYQIIRLHHEHMNL